MGDIPALPSLAQMLMMASGIAETIEGRRAEDAARIQALQRDVTVLWDVAYECMERGDAFYALVERRTRQTREQAERHFMPDNAGDKRGA